MAKTDRPAEPQNLARRRLVQTGVIKRKVHDDLALMQRIENGSTLSIDHATLAAEGEYLHGAFYLGSPEFYEWLRTLPEGQPVAALWLDGVGNPHNFGAILRSAAHFGVAGILLPRDSTLALSGAAARVAEGGAEQVPLVRMGQTDNAAAQLRNAGFSLAATLVRGGDDLFAATLPQRLVYVMGAEGEGMDARLAEACDLRLSIPGSGAVESLNVAAATAVFLAQWKQRL